MSVAFVTLSLMLSATDPHRHSFQVSTRPTDAGSRTFAVSTLDATIGEPHGVHVVRTTHASCPHPITSALSAFAASLDRDDPISARAAPFFETLASSLAAVEVGPDVRLATGREDDGAVFVTFARPSQRLTLVVGAPGDSSWHFVSKRSAGGSQVFGDLDGQTPLQQILGQMFRPPKLTATTSQPRSFAAFG